MLCLDDDCLDLIFRYFSLKEQLTMTRVCQRFRDIIVACIWSSQYRNIYTDRPTDDASEKDLCAYNEVATLNKEEYEEFFALNVQNLEKLYLGNITRQAFSTYLGRHIQRPDFPFYFLFKCLRLIELTCFETNVHDGHIRMLTENSPYLETLNICTPYVTGRYIKNLRLLRSLIAFKCNLKCEYLNEIIAESDCLMFLDVRANNDLEQNVITTWGPTLRGLHMCEKQFHKQFTEYTLPERLGSIRLLNVDCDKTAATDEDAYRIAKVKWIQFFKNYGKTVKTLKMTPKSESIIDALENIYNDTSLPVFPRMEELHVKLDVAGDRLKPLFCSTQLHALHLHHTLYLERTLELIQNNLKLKFILIEDHFRNMEKICTFINNTLRLLEVQPNRADINLLLEDSSQESIKLRNELENRFGPEIFKEGYRLKVEITSKRINIEQRCGLLDFVFHD